MFVCGVFLGVACVAFLVPQSEGELFTSMAHLQTALWAEGEIASTIQQYVKEEEERLAKLKSIATELETHSASGKENPEFYLGNPVNAYLFVKRFTLDWENFISDQLTTKTTPDLDERIEPLKQDLPTYEDLNGAVSALLRLQDTYQLDTGRIARGDLGGARSTSLTAADCFELGRVAYNEEDFYHTALWMEQTLQKIKMETNKTVSRKDVLDYLSFTAYKWWPWSVVSMMFVAEECFYIGRQAYTDHDFYHSTLWMGESLVRDNEEVNKTVDRVNVLDYLAFSSLKQGNIEYALTLTNELLSLVPEHTRAQNNKDYYERMLADKSKNRKKRGDTGDENDGEIPVFKNERQLDEYRNSEEFLTYESLCRGERTQEYKHQHRLVCRYRHNKHPLLWLSPAKEEEIYLKPWLVFYHNVLTDAEMEVIKHLATPRLGRATVHNSVTGKLEFAQYRISKSAWLKDEDHFVITRVNRRIEAVTGLNMETAEDLQIANYGLGGHYEPHFDFARKRELTSFEKRVGNRIATFLSYKDEKEAFKSLGTGNRIATWLTYMTDVEAGGATVFPYLGVRIFPEKGGAAFWYNLDKSGEGIFNTRHAACPVLVGIKWVSNKWIHERGQEFRRPCGLRADQ